MQKTLDEFEFFLEKDWSDGLPVVTPTEERVRGMLKATRCDFDEVIGPIPPAGEIATVRSIAVHAGCLIMSAIFLFRDRRKHDGQSGLH